MTQRRSGQREAYWREQVKRHEGSGLSVRQFCQEGRLSEASFYAWRMTLRLRAREAQAAAFVPVVVASPSLSGSYIVELRGGRKLHLPDSLALDRVIALLRGLEASEVSP